MEKKIKELEAIGFITERNPHPITGSIYITCKPSNQIMKSLGYDSGEDCIEFTCGKDETVFSIGSGFEGCGLLIKNKDQADLIQKALKILFSD